MPIRVRVSTELGLIVMVGEGIVTAEEIELRLAPLIERPEYSLLPSALVDMTTAERFDGPTDAIRRNVRRVAEYVDSRVPLGSRMAFVAPRDELFGLGRMYEMLRSHSPVEFRVFRVPEEAERWLQLPRGYEASLSDLP